MSAISVIMPVHNAEKFVGQAIQSILNQSFTNFEFLIIDDDSSDNSLEIIKSFNDSRIHLFENSKNGIAYQLNFGISKAKSDFIARMDADDISHPNRLGEQLDYIKLNKDLAVIGTNCFIIDSDNLIREKRKYPENHFDILNSMPIEQTISHPSVLMRKDIFKYGSYESEYEPVEDHRFFLKLLDKGFKFHNLQKFLLFYRTENYSSISPKTVIQKQFSYNIGKDFIIRRYEAEKYLYGKGNYYYKIGLIEYNIGNMKEARVSFLKYLKYSEDRFFILFRYIIPSLLGKKFFLYIRQNNISIRINHLLKKIGIQTHKV